MANTLKIKRSSVAGKVPLVADLQLGELAVNTYDGKLYTRKNDGTDSVVLLSAGTGDVAGPSSAVDNALARYDGTTGKLIQSSTATLSDTGVLATAGASSGYLDLTPSTGITGSTGRLWYNSEDDSLNIIHDAGVVQTVGQEFYLPPCKNTSGVAINNGTVVMATGAQGDKITIAAAVTNGTVAPEYLIGVATETIGLDAEYGHIVTDGVVRDIDTSAWPVGTVLYSNPAIAGGLTSTKPAAPNIKVPIAIVLRQNATAGRIYVRMSYGSKLGDTDSNVQITSSAAGDVLIYNGTTQIWENKPQSALVAGSANKWAAARTITLGGDLTGNVSLDGSADVTLTATVAANSIVLGTDTTGNYVAGVTAGTGISISGTAGEAWSPTVALATAGTAGTYTKVTTDAYGRVTSGTTLAATDIPSLDASKITSGTIDAARLPSYVDDILEYTNLASFPATGEAGKIYVALDTNKTYRWSGTAYVYITSGAVDSVQAGNAITVSATTGVVTVNHADTSSVANVSSDNSGNTFIQDISLIFDTYGHVTGATVATGTASFTDTNTTYTLDGSGTTNSVNIELVAGGSGSGTDTINVIGSGATTVAWDEANQRITISSTDTNTTYSVATSSANGLIKLFSDTAQTVAANAVTATASRTYGVQVNASGQAVVNVPWTDTNTTYSTATSTTLGLIKLFSDTAQTVEANAVTATASRTYGVQVNASGQAVVNVPWTDTTANQTITLSGDVTGSGTTAITATLTNSGVTAGTYTKVTVDAKGRATAGASLASTDVTTALGYTPYNSTNPNNYTGVTEYLGIGSVALLLPVGTTSVAFGGTVSGADLRYDYAANANAMNGEGVVPFAAAVKNSTSTYAGGGTAVSGTWRKISSGSTYFSTTVDSVTTYWWIPALFMRTA